ncbi:hypothetical protein [Peptoniphilus sp.]|uniref:hypothetical protein n=1 Tax=Peptoniphilus sp. TaxID=1971214 RepID=UPI0039963134
MKVIISALILGFVAGILGYAFYAVTSKVNFFRTMIDSLEHEGEDTKILHLKTFGIELISGIIYLFLIEFCVSQYISFVFKLSTPKVYSFPVLIISLILYVGGMEIFNQFEINGFKYNPPFVKYRIVFAYVLIMIVANIFTSHYIVKKTLDSQIRQKPVKEVVVERKKTPLAKNLDYEIMSVETISVPQLNLPIGVDESYRTMPIENIKIYTELTGRENLINLTKKIMKDNKIPGNETRMFAYFYDKRDVNIFGYTTGTVYYAPGGIVGHAYEKDNFEFAYINKRHVGHSTLTDEELNIFYEVRSAIENPETSKNLDESGDFLYEACRYVGKKHRMDANTCYHIYKRVKATKEY